MEHFYFTVFQCQCRHRTRLCSISNFICPLYLFYFSYLWKKAKNPKIPVSFLLFIDNKLFISQEKYFEKTNMHLFCSYNMISSLLNQFELIIEYGKTKVFHFYRSHSLFNPSPLDFSHIGGPILCLKDSWRYLGFIFDRKLLFQQHVKFYSNKVFSIVKSMKMLGNSTCSLLPHQKWLFYKTCVLPVTLYGFLPWHFNKAPLIYPLRELREM